MTKPKVVNPLEQLVLLECIGHNVPQRAVKLANVTYYVLMPGVPYDPSANDMVMDLYRHGPRFVSRYRKGEFQAVVSFMSALRKRYVERGYRLIRDGKVVVVAGVSSLAKNLADEARAFQGSSS